MWNIRSNQEVLIERKAAVVIIERHQKNIIKFMLANRGDLLVSGHQSDSSQDRLFECHSMKTTCRLFF
jgi:hypothetical protein